MRRVDVEAPSACQRLLTSTALCTTPSLTRTSLHRAGEYGDLLVGPEGGKLLEGEEPVDAGEADVLALLEAVLQVGAPAGLHVGQVPVNGYRRRSPSRAPARLPQDQSPLVFGWEGPPSTRPVASPAAAKHRPSVPRVRPHRAGQAGHTPAVQR